MISVNSLKKSTINTLFYYANNFEENDNDVNSCMKGKILCNAFFEPSTRTMMSFESAMLRLGGNIINFNPITSSLKKGETFEDTMKTLQEYSDIIVLRHPENDRINEAEQFLDKPIINGGNGDGEHPTQALLDLYTINKNINTKNIINICFIGDILHSRTIHSLLILLSKYQLKCDISFLCYPNCEPDEKLKQIIESLNYKINYIEDLTNIEHYDVIYCSRLQKERIKDLNSFDISKYQLTGKNIQKMKSNSIILHPLPRNEEISIEVDKDCRAKYFEQVKNGVYIRMAIIYCIVFNQLDNIFCTEEHSYRSQLRSEIHAW